LVSALAAGNTVIIKPSEYNTNVSAMIAEMVAELFDEKIVAVFEGGTELSQELLTLPFDHIFFTGSTNVGKIVMRAAAENLTSVTLELGGKSPVIVSDNARISEAAERITVGKFVNAGQTCIAPDYVLVHSSIAEALTNRIVDNIKKLFDTKSIALSQPSHYTRIVSQKHFDRLVRILDNAVSDGGKIIYTGDHDRESRTFYPTIVANVSMTSEVMEEEIFGPILPLIKFETLAEAVEFVNKKPKPLVLYFFSGSKSDQDWVLKSTSAGGACINDCAIHFLQHRLPFGGVNSSGIGKAHEFAGFLAFSNEKPVLKQRRGFTSVKALYPPYTQLKHKIVDLLFRIF
jgi:aldehyde dehydrogenase (NAD+)